MDIPEFNFWTKLEVSLREPAQPVNPAPSGQMPKSVLEKTWDPGPLTEVLRLNPDLHDQLAKAIAVYQDAQKH